MNKLSINYLISDKKIILTIKNIEIIYKITFISTFIWGIFAHGVALFNKYSFYDDIGNIYDGIGSTISSGRWLLAFFHFLKLRFNFYYSIPAFYGFLVIFLIAVINVLLVYSFSIKNAYFCVFLSGLTICFPTVCSMFFYIFTAFYYVIGIFMSIFGAWLLCRNKHWYTRVIAVILMGSSLGIYQANAGIYISFILLYMIKDTYENQRDMKSFCKYTLQYIFCIICSLLFYFTVNKVVLNITNTTLTEYKGIANVDNIPLTDYLYRIAYAYKLFIFPNYHTESIYPNKSIFIYWLILCITVILTLVLIIKKWKENKLYAIELLLLTSFVPLVINFAYVITEAGDVYALMQYSHIFLYVYFSWLVTRNDIDIDGKYVIRTVATICIFLLAFIYCRNDNTRYLNAELKQQRAISYITTLVANIKATENYKDEYPVTFVNSENMHDLSFHERDDINCITYIPDSWNIVSGTSWIEFAKVWTGYNPVVLEENKFKDLPEVKNMPYYPDDGSIKVIDKTVVVKF